MPAFHDLSIEIRYQSCDYAIEIVPVTAGYQWQYNQTRITGYRSLIRVSKQVREVIQSLHTQDRALDIILFFDNLAALLSAFKTSQKYRILHDDKFRIASVVGDRARLDKADEDVREFVLASDGFNDE